MSVKVNIILIHFLHYFGQLTKTGHSPIHEYESKSTRISSK